MSSEGKGAHTKEELHKEIERINAVKPLHNPFSLVPMSFLTHPWAAHFAWMGYPKKLIIVVQMGYAKLSQY
jgi:hypothetical protein